MMMKRRAINLENVKMWLHMFEPDVLRDPTNEQNRRKRTEISEPE